MRREGFASRSCAQTEPSSPLLAVYGERPYRRGSRSQHTSPGNAWTRRRCRRTVGRHGSRILRAAFGREGALRELLHRWGWGIALIGVAVVTSGIQRGSVVEIVVGSLAAVAGAGSWIGSSPHRIGWVVAAVGAGFLTVGIVGGNVFGAPIAPRTLPLLIVGPLLIVAGALLRGVLLARQRRARSSPGRDDISPLGDGEIH